MRQPTRNVFSASEVRAFDRRAINEFSIPGVRLMHRAGRAAFDVLRSRWPDARILSIICGSGNNAGDGYVVAGCAKDAGFDVQLIPVGDPGKLAGEAMQACRFAEARLGGRFEQQLDGWSVGGDVVVDALLGTGAQGAVRLPYQTAVDRINAAGKPVLALDLPSGVDAENGGLLTAHPVRADVTVTFVAAKLGLVTGDAVDFVGELLLDDLDLPEAVFDRPGVRVMDGAGLATLARRPGAHKGDFGRLLVVGGETDMGGAVLLAGEAALRTGAGLVTIATRSENRAAILARRPELMVRGVEDPKDIADLVERASAIAVGPGLGRSDWGNGLLRTVADAGKPMVVDADGLNIVADRSVGLPPATIVTPHPGEAGRLLGETTTWIQSNRPEAAARLSKGNLSGAIAVLKGAGTLIAMEGAVASVCLGGNPGMATAGSGDVLTGIVGALLARGLEPLAAAELGVWLHARAGDEARAGHAGSLIAGDLIGALRLTA
ncbi:MAG: NAD(P)H-hydrate dehydratase [Gammaproteobacteria bacterium]|nr:NAD(P)H-hydrate dehydratase [Gammaproteobacteria bacterium]